MSNKNVLVKVLALVLVGLMLLGCISAVIPFL